MYISRAVADRAWPPTLEERSGQQQGNERQAPSPTPLKSPAGVLEQFLGEADALIRRRLEEAGLDVPHLIVAVTPDSEVVLRSNVSMDVVKAFGAEARRRDRRAGHGGRHDALTAAALDVLWRPRLWYPRHSQWLRAVVTLDDGQIKECLAHPEGHGLGVLRRSVAFKGSGVAGKFDHHRP